MYGAGVEVASRGLLTCNTGTAPKENPTATYRHEHCALNHSYIRAPDMGSVGAATVHGDGG